MQGLFNITYIYDKKIFNKEKNELNNIINRTFTADMAINDIEGALDEDECATIERGDIE